MPAAIVFTGILVYGILLPTWGFYWDDWAKISVARLQGLSGYWFYYAEDRPLSSWTHILFTPLLGFQPLGWHLLQFGLTGLAAWGVYWTLTRLVPGAHWLAASTAMIFLVYPVFTAHPAAVTFHQQWLQYAFLLLSLGTMLAAARARQRSQKRFLGLTLLALLLSALQLSITEYFASLELVRPLLLWVVCGQLQEAPEKMAPGVTPARAWYARLLQTAQHAAPYLALLAAYGAWRFLFRPFAGEDPYGMVTLQLLLARPAALPEVLIAWLQDSLHTLISVWGPLLAAGPLKDLKPFQILALLLSGGAGLFTFVYLARLERHPALPDQVARWRGALLGIAAAAFLLGMLPGWMTGHSVTEDFHADRYALPAIFGAALLWAMAIEWITPARAQRALLVAILISLSAGQQLRTGNEYRWLWETETRLFWQLYWRAPHLQPGTALFSYQEIFPNQGLFSSSAALNLLYPQPQAAAAGEISLSYWWYSLYPRYDINEIEEPINLSMRTQFRSLTFQGGTPNTLLIHYDPAHSSCLWVITSEDQNEPGLPPLTKAMRSISNLQQINAEPLDGWRPPEEFFGPEPEHNWCYLYEKAELARQFRDWKQIVQLGEQARAQGYSPSDSRSNAPREWLPFIEGYARTGYWQEAMDLTTQSAQQGKEFNVMLAQLWQKLATTTPDTPEKFTAVYSIENLLQSQK